MLKVNQHILHLHITALLQNAELLMFLWFLVTKHMIHFKNQSSQQRLRWKISIKMLTDKKSDLSYLQIWNFKVIYHIFKQKHVKSEKYRTCREIDYLVEYEDHIIKQNVEIDENSQKYDDKDSTENFYDENDEISIWDFINSSN